MTLETIRLTEFSHGAGCGCKISPKVLTKILSSSVAEFIDPKLLVGNSSRDDAAVYQLDDHTGIVSTTDFFMPIVDDPYTFGQIAATNAISDIYAMGASPCMALAILGWPVSRLAPEVAQQVIEGGRQKCAEAGIMLAGGHSIDSAEPIFGLAVTGRIALENLKPNNSAQAGDRLYLTKPLGVGILSTAQKKKLATTEDIQQAINAMTELNTIGVEIAEVAGVNALTDVTGFGLAGHLIEMCQGAGLTAQLDFDAIVLMDNLDKYLEQNCVPGGTLRNFDSYGELIAPLSDRQKHILCDPQTSGGLLVSVSAQHEPELRQLLAKRGITPVCIGELTAATKSHAIELR
ncbi:selenide, water dikinase SelD [Paraferrimonas sedimenticola]|uniref:Selenide, water dikinase n=1 Tax=Paraferrimonas sedimenticola TaxID=375674 RepID=A0AA37RYY9_9GAMM|nr:selenide, water dikinase SelD [Paraferrimonas sedimenticola]GLP97322.1 selenide, water dikinase [Paraferrimonas sedimenticola]